MANKNRNIKIWQETVIHFTNSTDKPQGKSVKYQWPLNVVPSQFPDRAGIVAVHRMDTLDCCKMLIDSGLLVAGLNMASASNPGGGVYNGSNTQEENLWRRSDYFRYMPRELYPLFGIKGIYTSNVTVIRGSDYNWITPYLTDLIAVPAKTHPFVTSDLANYINIKDRQVMEQRAELIFQMALANGRTALVLGAWGCGAFKNPIPAVIDIFNGCIRKWGKKFDNISFAVLGDNYEPFAKGIH